MSDSTNSSVNANLNNDTDNNTDGLTPDDLTINHHLDTQGLICPEPVMMLHRAIRRADSGDYIEILATDPATTRDIPNFCRHLGHTLIDNSNTPNPNLELNSPSDDNNQPIDSALHTLYRFVIQKK